MNEGGLGFPLFGGVWGFSVFSPSPLKRAIEGGRESWLGPQRTVKHREFLQIWGTCFVSRYAIHTTPHHTMCSFSSLIGAGALLEIHVSTRALDFSYEIPLKKSNWLSDINLKLSTGNIPPPPSDGYYSYLF